MDVFFLCHELLLIVGGAEATRSGVMAARVVKTFKVGEALHLQPITGLARSVDIQEDLGGYFVVG